MLTGNRLVGLKCRISALLESVSFDRFMHTFGFSEAENVIYDMILSVCVARHFFCVFSVFRILLALTYYLSLSGFWNAVERKQE